MNHIVNYTIPCQPHPLTEFLRFGADWERFYFESDQSPLAIAGLGITAQILRTDSNRFASLSQDLREFFQRVTLLNDSDDTPLPILLGGGSFFAEMKPGEWDSFPQAALVLPRYALIRANGRYYFSVNLALTETETIASASQRACNEAEAILARFESAILPTPSIPDEITTNETSRVIWQNTLRQSVEMIHQGQLKKVVMARPVQVNGNRSIDVPSLLESLGESCPSCFRFLFEFSPTTTFAGATPERLVSVSGAKFTTAAIAGSIRRGDFPAEDDALARRLIESQKDQSEHSFVKNEIRARLENLVASLHIDLAPRLLRLPNIQHLWTHIEGRLHPNQSVLDLVAALHPTPAVGGVPTETALQLIHQLEGFERGWYAGPVGWVDADGNGDFVVAIRSGLFRGNTATLFGGAGIVADSDPDEEWEETGLKIRFLLNATRSQTELV
ncbi:MAG: isochorismate synthase [Chloroflexi bacterium]|nr:isochorismate synthase [Chloroflexota bacterium]